MTESKDINDSAQGKPVGEASESNWREWLSHHDLGPFIALLVVLAVFFILDSAIGSGNFASTSNLKFTLNQASIVAVPALGMTLIIIGGGIDLSIGTAVSLCATVLAVALREEQPLWIALSATIMCGCLCGLINGAMISFLKVIPFVVTLGTMTIFLGAGMIISGGVTVESNLDEGPWLLRALCSTRKQYLFFGLVPLGVLVALVLAAIVHALLNYTVFGRYVYAVGSSEATARLCGVNIPLVKMAIFVVAGLLVGIGGAYSVSNVSSVNPREGVGFELEVIAAVVLGGGSLRGGRGSVFGTLCGALIMATIIRGCGLLDFSQQVSLIIIGVSVVAAVTIDQLRQSPPRWLSKIFRAD